VVVTVDGHVPNVRPGFTCTAVITTATRKQVLGVPIQAMTLREVVVDDKGEIVRPENNLESHRRLVQPVRPISNLARSGRK
jgi:HlyD family secretion protein